MKRHVVLVAFVAALLLVAAAFLPGCQKGETTSLTLTKEEIAVKPGSRVDVGAYVVREGGGAIAYAVENTDVLSIDGSTVTAKAEGEGAVVVTSGAFIARLKIRVTNGNRLNVRIPDATVVYDGAAHYPDPIGYLPEGATVTYTMNGEPFFGATAVGTYIVDATLTVPDGYVAEQTTFRVTLTIRKARYDLSGISFSNRTFVYDGEEKAVFLSGILPEGVSVTYTGNRATDAGRYTAYARFSGGSEMYEEISDMTCIFTVEPRVFSLVEHGFGDRIKAYDGEGTTLSVEGLPQGATIAFYATEEGAPYDAEAVKNAGAYSAYARITATESVVRNYTFTTASEILSFTGSGNACVSGLARGSVTVTKAVLPVPSFVAVDAEGNAAERVVYGQTLAAAERTADVNFLLEGEGPVGVKNEFAGRYTVEYSLPAVNDRGFVDSGDREVTATFRMPDGYDANYETLPVVKYAFTVNKAPVNVSAVAFSSDLTEVVFDGSEYVFTLENVDETTFSTAYDLKRNGYPALKILHAGTYILTATLTKKEDAANYTTVPPFVKSFVILPRTIDLSGVAFSDATETYDGERKGLTITGELPDGVSVTYAPSASYVDAGTYPISATFTYASDVAVEEDIRFAQGGVDSKTMRATLTILRARYDASAAEGIAAQTGLTWRYGMTFEDVALSGDARWADPKAAIGALRPVSETEGTATARAYWNGDPANYENLYFDVTVTIKKATVDLSGASIPEQFVTKNGAEWGRVYVAGGAPETYTEVEKTGETYTVTIRPVWEENCVVTGNNVFPNARLYPYDGRLYSYDEGTTALRAYTGAATAVDVPTGTSIIRSEAFSGTSVSSVVVPDTVVSVETGALDGATRLRRLTLPTLSCVGGEFLRIFGGIQPSYTLDLVLTEQTALEDCALEGARMLSGVTFKKPPVSFGTSAFSGCVALRELTYETTALTTVGENAFYRCSALRTLRLPSLIGGTAGSNVTLTYYFGTSADACGLETLIFTTDGEYTLAQNALRYAPLKSVLFAPGLTAIGSSAFEGVEADLDLSGTALTTLGNGALQGYAGGSVRLPDGLETVGRYAFRNATCKTIALPASVSRIDPYAFQGCAADVRFAEDSLLTTIGEDAFNGWLGKEIALPGGVTTLGARAFYHATGLTTVDVNGVTGIGESCFEGCGALTGLEFGAAASIGNYAMKGCSSLTSVRFRGLNPPETEATGAFDTQGAVLTVYVKNGADESAFRAYLDASGATGHYLFARY